MAPPSRPARLIPRPQRQGSSWRESGPRPRGDWRFAPLIAKLFEWYARGDISLKEAARKAHAAGLVYPKSGAKVPVSTIQTTGGQVPRYMLLAGTCVDRSASSAARSNCSSSQRDAPRNPATTSLAQRIYSSLRFTDHSGGQLSDSCPGLLRQPSLPPRAD